MMDALLHDLPVCLFKIISCKRIYKAQQGQTRPRKRWNNVQLANQVTNQPTGMHMPEPFSERLHTAALPVMQSASACHAW